MYVAESSQVCPDNDDLEESAATCGLEFLTPQRLSSPFSGPFSAAGALPFQRACPKLEEAGSCLADSVSRAASSIKASRLSR